MMTKISRLNLWHRQKGGDPISSRERMKGMTNTGNFKSIHIDTEKGVYLLNGEDMKYISHLDLEYENGKWSLSVTKDEFYSQVATREVTE